MSTNSVLQFQTQEGEPLCSVYVHSSTDHETFIDELAYISVLHARHKRCRWDFFFPLILSSIIQRQVTPGLRLLDNDTLIENVSCTIYFYTIKPNSDYADDSKSMAECIDVRVQVCSSKEQVYSGRLSEYN